MADEAILRIILDDRGVTSAAHTPSTSAPSSAAGVPARPTTSAPLPVTVVSAPKPPPAPAAPVPATAPDWMKSLINPDWTKNPHVLLEGQSGSGKSVAARHIAFERMRLGHDVHVVDPHNPEKWGGAKQVFQGETAGPDASKFMMDLLKGRIKQQQDAGKTPVDFKPVTVVLSDFANMMKNTPSLQTEFAHILTEARKFKIAIVADTTALNQAESGLQGIDNVRRNLGQKAQFYAGSDADPQRRVRIASAGAVRANKSDPLYDTPNLPMYEDRVDYGLKRSSSETTPTTLVGAAAAARRLFEMKKYKAEVNLELAKLEPPEPPEMKKIKPIFEGMLEAAQSLRGTLGGTFGTLVGVGLDITSRIYSAKKNAPKAPTAQVAPSGAKQAVVPVLGAENLASGGMGVAASIAVVGAVVAAVVIGFKSLISEADKMAERYGEYNPEIAQAQAMAEVRKITNDMRRAQEAGGELAAYIEAQSEMQNRWEDVKVALMSKILPTITGILEILSILLSIASNRDTEELMDPTSVILGNELFRNDPLNRGGMEVPGR